MNIALLSAIISFLSLDITIAFQMLISSPIFACPILGWLLGDIWLGFELGFLLQLLWLGRIPAGAYIVPEGNIASMIVTILVLLNRENTLPNTTLAVVFSEGIFISYLGAVITILYRKLNGKILDIILRQVQSVHFNIMLLLEASSMVVYFLLVFAFSYVIIQVNQQFLPPVIKTIGGLFENQFIVVKPAILGIGMAFVLPIFRDALDKNVRNKIE